MIDLSQVTAVTVDGDGSRYEVISNVISAMKEHFAFADIKVFSTEKGYSSECTLVRRRCSSIREYNHICLFELDEHVKTDYCLIFHHDGFPMFPKNWLNEFLSVDYIGAPWEVSRGHDWAEISKVGNGGFSIRSKRLLSLVRIAARELGRRATVNNEDGFICLTLKDYLNKNGCVFADYPLARRFSIETLLDTEGLSVIERSFGFHDTDNNITQILKEAYGEIYSVPNSIFCPR